MVSIPERRRPTRYDLPVDLTSHPLAAKTAAVAPLTTFTSVHEAVAQQEWQRKIMDWVVEGPGVLGFALNLKATVCALGRWYVAEPDSSGGWRRVQSAKEQAILHAYRGVNGEPREELFRQQMFTTESIGEFLLATHNTDHGPRYELLQMNQIAADRVGSGDYLAIQDTPAQRRQDTENDNDYLRYLPKDQVVRIWQRNPWWPNLAHSQMQRAVPDIERLISSTRRIKRLSDSRLVNNDIVWLAAEAAMQYAGLGDEQRRADFHRDFRNHAQKTFTEYGGVAEVAPFTLSTGYQWGPPMRIDMGDPIEEYDLAAEDSGYKAIGRALDLPMRVFFESEQGGNHWSDWLTESQFIRTSAEPSGQKGLDQLTISWLRPMYEFLQSVGWLPDQIDPQNRRIMLDMSGVLKNPDESKALLEAYRYGIPSRDTVAKRGLNLTEDEIMEMPSDYDDFRTWAEFVARPVGGKPMGPDAFADSKPPEQARLASALSAGQENNIPPQLLGLALRSVELEPDDSIRKAEEVVYLDHDAYAEDSDLLELL